MKICKSCNKLKSLENFCIKRDTKDGRHSQCKECKTDYQKIYRKTNKGKIANSKGYNSWRINNLQKKAFKESIRRSDKLKRTPKWTNLKDIEIFYANCPKGYHVDHIIPLKGKDVSGLHVLENLQYLPAIDNIKKGNKYGTF